MKYLVLIALMLGTISTTKAQEPALYQEVWKLFKVQIDGTTLDIPANSEVASIFIDFTDVEPLPDTVTTTVCNELFGYVTVTPDFKLTFSDLTQTLDSCDMAVNAAFEAAYFDFFFNNEGVELTYDILIPLGPRSVKDEIFLIIYSPSGDTLEYSGGPGAGVDEFATNNLKLFPNPATTTLQWDNTLGDNLTASVYSLDGKQVLTTTTQQNQLDVSWLASGLYVLELSNPKGRVVKRFVKQ